MQSQSEIWNINSSQLLEKSALEAFKIQAETEVYGKFIKALGINSGEIQSINQILFLPVRFFKNQTICNLNLPIAKVFESSTTSSGTPSKHFVNDLKIYEESYLRAFKQFYGNPEDYIFIALLPSYLERGTSSLLYMMDDLIKKSNHSLSGYYLDEIENLSGRINEASKDRKVFLWGVTYALLDFAEINKTKFNNLIVLETGGMKGRRAELTREELHTRLCDSFGVNKINSEYGMTELLSQAYSQGDGLFKSPPWMKIIITELNDPFKICAKGISGRINVIDLANINSCSFLATDDLGKLHEDGSFEVLGRIDNTETRGCNLMVSDLI